MYLNGEFPYNSHDNIKLYKDNNFKYQIPVLLQLVPRQNVRAKCAINVCLNTWHCYVKSVGNSHYKYTERFD